MSDVELIIIIHVAVETPSELCRNTINSHLN